MHGLPSNGHPIRHVFRSNGQAGNNESLDVNYILIVALLVLYASFRTLIKYRIWQHEHVGLGDQTGSGILFICLS
jgi:tellurite resistance protein TehA-like permease